jgi:type IV pilus assembly protein PilF
MARRRPTIILFLLLGTLLFSACATTGVTPEDKKRANAARNLGEAYLSEGNYTAALGELLKAEKLNAHDPILHNDLGLAYLAKDRVDLAVEHFEKAVRLKPDYSLAKNNLGSVYLVQEKWDKAIGVLKEVTGDMLYATPQFPLANLGWAYYNLGKYDLAEQYLKEAQQLQPNFSIAQLNLGRTYRATGRLHAALNQFETVVKNNPTNPEVLLELGKTYRLLGDYHNARLALRAAIEHTENSNLAVEASEELKKIYQ